jgi:hypothetical protein
MQYLTGAKSMTRLDSAQLMRDTDRGFRIIAARLNRVVNSH